MKALVLDLGDCRDRSRVLRPAEEGAAVRARPFGVVMPLIAFGFYCAFVLASAAKFSIDHMFPS